MPLINLVLALAATPGYISKEDGFEAWFPSRVGIEKTVTVIPSGQLVTTIYSCPYGEQLFQVAVTGLPQDLLQKNSISDLLLASRDGLATVGTVTKDEGLWLGRNMARRFVIEKKEGPSNVNLITIADGRFYHVSALVPASKIQSGLAFVASFRFHEPVDQISSLLTLNWPT